MLLRHGRTAYNHEKRVQGQREVELDDVGHAQAAAVAPVLAALAPDLLWSSDLTRARQTAAYLAKETGLEAVHDARLREYHLGERQGITHDEYAAAHPAEYLEFRQAHYDVVPGAEPTVEVVARMRAVVADLLAALPPGGLGVAVSHGAAIRISLAPLLGLPGDTVESLRALDNCGWVELSEDPDGSPTPRRLRLAAYNRVAPAG